MSNTQEEYIQSLRKIKEAEENVQKIIESHRKKIDEEIKKIQTEMDDSIAKSKLDGEKLVESSIEKAKKNAITEKEKIIEVAKEKAKKTFEQLNPQTVKEIIDILLKGVD